MKRLIAILLIIFMSFSLTLNIFAQETDESAGAGGEESVPVEQTPTSKPTNYNDPEKIFTDSSFSLASVDEASLAYWYSLEVNVPDAALKRILMSLAGNPSKLCVGNLVNLPTELNLAGLGISNITGLKYALNTKSLNLSNNTITAFEALKSMYKLESLNISDNTVTILPSYITELPSLDTLIADNNQIISLDSPSKNSRIENLSVANNAISQFPDLTYFPRVNVLNLSGNKIEAITDELKKVNKLVELNMSNNLITTTCDFTSFSRLSILNLSGNSLNAFPIGLETLTLLKEVYLDNNRITSMPENLTQMSSLEVLSLNANNIRRIPSKITEVSTLKTFNIILNQIKIADYESIVEKLKKSLETFTFELQKPTFDLEYNKKENTITWNEIKNIATGDGSVTIDSLEIARKTREDGSKYKVLDELEKTATKYTDKTSEKGEKYIYRLSVHCTATQSDGTTQKVISMVYTADENQDSGSLFWIIIGIVFLLIVLIGAGIFTYITIEKKNRKKKRRKKKTSKKTASINFEDL